MVDHKKSDLDPSAEYEKIRAIISTVTDPEIPVLSVEDLGVIRGVEVTGNQVSIQLTPTYTGCPAMDTISDDIKIALKSAGYESKIEMVLSPAWSTDWISEDGRKKMEAYGIAPPMEPLPDKLALLHDQKIVKCIRCGSKNTRLISQFGSTACKALFQCEDCHEPFDYFKCLK
jgi:ring-1,2-phenylacetyl-CoA epoxidase subunit PaaD